MTQSQYRQNIDIVKGYFRKPIVLICAITSFVTIIYGFVEVLLSSDNTALISFSNASATFISGYKLGYFFASLIVSVPGILLALSFLLFYILSKKPDSNLSAPSVIFKVVSIIQFVFVCLGLVFSLLILVAFGLAYDTRSSVLFLFFGIMLFFAVAITFVFYIAQLIFACSIRKSLTSVYITGKGAAFFGVTKIIQAVFSVIIIFSLFVSSSSVPRTLGGLDVSAFSPSASYLSIISFALAAINSIVLAVMGFGYNSYIKGITRGFNTEPQYSVTNEPYSPQPVQNIQQPPIEQVFPNLKPQNNVPPAPQAPTDRPFEPQMIICKTCGQQLNPDDYFCNNCGAPIER